MWLRKQIKFSNHIQKISSRNCDKITSFSPKLCNQAIIDACR